MKVTALTLLSLLIGMVHASEHPRIIISTDLGGDDPDDYQSMVHYLVYADEFDTEGLISSPPGSGRAKDILDCLDAYASDFENLRSWSSDYPKPDRLRATVKQGALVSQEETEPESPSEGAQWILARARVDDPRPLHLLVWGSLTDVAQAVHADPSIKRKIRIYSIGSWNTKNGRRERAYLFENHPDLWWIESDTTFRGIYQGGDQEGDLGNLSFSKAHLEGHGSLGDLFMEKRASIKMGDTPSVLFFLRGDSARPEGNHWGGSFVRPSPVERPHYWYDNPDPKLKEGDKEGARTVNVWRREYLRDWQTRMDRTQSRKKANPELSSGEYSTTQSWSQEKNYPRPWLVHVPGNATDTSLPALIYLHGNGGNAKRSMNHFLNRYRKISDQFILVFPEGYRKSWNIVSERSTADDRAFIESIIFDLGSRPNVDADEISVMGNSNGAALANQIAIETKLPRIRNFITGVSQLNTFQHDGSNFRAKGDDNRYSEAAIPMKRIRLLNISGISDSLVPYDGGPSRVIPARGGKLPFVPAEESIFLWARAMGYTGPKLTQPSRTEGNAELFEYLDGDIAHWKITDKGHNATGALDEAELLRFLKSN